MAWSDWSDWSTCETKCNKSSKSYLVFRHRTRECILPNALKKIPLTINKPDCVGLHKETKLCESRQILCEKSKAIWSEWSVWSTCSNSCNLSLSEPSVQTRHRQCLSNGLPSLDCDGVSKEKRNCVNENKCLENRTEWNSLSGSEWSNWSRCSGSCGSRGFKSRIRTCSKKYNDFPCETGKGALKKA